jgi:hypothetical protein
MPPTEVASTVAEQSETVAGINNVPDVESFGALGPVLILAFLLWAVVTVAVAQSI